MSAIAANAAVEDNASPEQGIHQVSLDLNNLKAVPKQRKNLQARLQTAFSAFNDISSQLTQSYQELEDQIGELQLELARADHERLQEHSAREALAERLDVVLNAMPVAVILLDGRGVVAKANSIAETLLDHKLVGSPWIQVIDQCFSPEPADGHEVLLKNGKLVSLATQSLNSEPGQIIVFNDQTETRLLQNKLNHHRKLSEMGKMTASLAHQIRTPLSTAILYADHLASPDLSEDRRIRYASKLKNRLLQLEQQVRDMLIFSKGGVVLDAELPVFQLVSLFQAKADDYSQAKKARIEFSSELPAGSVRCNADLLISVFGNLLDNAVEACTQSGINPSLAVRYQIKAGSLIEIQIADNGPGVSEGSTQQLVEPFFTTKSTGTGLGLAVVKTVIEAHGGRFSISNSAAGGAIATIALPLKEQKQRHSAEV